MLAWNGLDQSKTIRALVIDGQTLQLVATLDTGVTPADRLGDRVLPGLGHDAVIAIAHGDYPGVALDLLIVDGRAIAKGPSLPVDSGLEIAPAGSTSVYVYNGPAKETVGQLDLATGGFTKDLPELRAPAGSYVVGLLSP